MDDAAESRLVTRCRRGDNDAWSELFDLHYAAAGRFVFQLSPELSREDVDDICQETFLSVVRHLRAFSGRSRLQTWILRIAANKARDFLERRHAVKRGGVQRILSLDAEDPLTGTLPEATAPRPGPDAQLLEAEQIAVLRAALDGLGDRCREIIELRYFADLDYNEIGRALNLKVKTVSSRLSRCLDRLEAGFQARFRFLGPGHENPPPAAERRARSPV